MKHWNRIYYVHAIRTALNMPSGPQSGRFNTWKKLLLLGCAVIVVLFAVGWALAEFSNKDLLSDRTHLEENKEPYDRADLRPSRLPSRRWMSFAIQIAKQESFAPTTTARFYAYVAGSYADALQETGDAAEAGGITKEILLKLAPKYSEIIEAFAKKEGVVPANAKSSVLSSYLERMTKDGYDLVWDKTIPPGENMWYNRNNKFDDGAMAGKWLPWIIGMDEVFDIPPPPVPGSILDKLELKKVEYAASHRHASDMTTVFFWHGTRAYEKGTIKDNITPAGVWQNILYIESKSDNDSAYAGAQKILAESIADSAIVAWREKYKYWTQRPSMRSKDVEFILADPPFPSYVSGHSTISATAATVLSSMFPSKEYVWRKNALNAAASRLVAGIHYDIDNEEGLVLGNKVGKAIVAKLSGTTDVSFTSPSRSIVASALELWMLEAQPFVAKAYRYLVNFDPWHRPTFRNVVAELNIKMGEGSRGLAWADINGDAYPDLLLVGANKTELVKLYLNNKQGGFIDATASSGLNKIVVFAAVSGIFGDYNNDGCPDLYIVVGYGSDILAKNNCDGTFKDVSKEAGIRTNYHGRGVAWADYDRDGYLDIYVANYGDFTVAGQHTYESNLLWHNNGDGTFTETAKTAGVEGKDSCGMDSNTNGFFATIFNKSPQGFKESFQPIWVDYDNDGLPDLFVATDSGVSPLYRNLGNGKFLEVTAAAKICKLGTGMGASAGDYDNDGDMDIYVTNTGRNFLWRNNGNGTFTESAAEAGVDDAGSLGWGAGFFDYNNDGYLDIYVVNGDVVHSDSLGVPIVGKIRVDRLYRNQGNGTFREVAGDEGIAGNDRKESMAFADYDRNGTMDVFVVNSYAEKNPGHRFYKNEKLNGNHWLEVELAGTRGNRGAIGARVKIEAGGQTQIRELSAGSSFTSEHSLQTHFGLGKNAEVSKLEIRWPDGHLQTFLKLKADQILSVKED